MTGKKIIIPIIQALDAAAPDTPVGLMGVTGHTSAVNTPALELLAPPDDTPGVMRDANGRPNGLAFSGFSEHWGADAFRADCP